MQSTTLRPCQPQPPTKREANPTGRCNRSATTADRSTRIRLLLSSLPPGRNSLRDCGREALARSRLRRRLPVVVAAAVLATALLPSTATAQDNSTYPDVPADAYYTLAVQTLDAVGVFDGTLCDDGFCPNGRIDRKTMAVWTVRVVDGQDPPAISRTRFNDVDAADFHARFIERMAELEVTSGCGDGSGFCPDHTVNRAQMAAFLSRAFNLPTAPGPNFTDVPHNAWYATYVGRLTASGITVGCGDGTEYCPDRATTRAQMATFLMRGMKLNPEPTAEVDPLAGPPRTLGLDAFYEKYLDADGIPIVSAAGVPDEALYRAKDIIGEMLSDRADLTASMAQGGIRVVVLGESASHSELPEWVGDPGESELRGFFLDPLVVTSEENLLCYPDDPHRDGGEVLIHEFAHAVHFVGIEERQPGSRFSRRLTTMFDEARAAGLWDYAYAATNSVEYWAEGVEIWFGFNEPGDATTREQLEDYDPNLAGLVTKVFGDATVTSSCKETDHRRTTLIQGVLTGPGGRALPEVLLWAWSGEEDNSRHAWTDPDGIFVMRVPDGSFTLYVYAAAEGQCAGWYDGAGSITTIREQAERLTAKGTAIKNITIKLPAPPKDLPSIQC